MLSPKENVTMEKISKDEGSSGEDFEDEKCDTESIKTGNHGWADAMNKILQMNKPKRKKTLTLSKAKKLCDVVKKPKEEVLPFELEKDGEVKREIIIKDDPEECPSADKHLQKRKDKLKIRVKPDILDRERERMLQKIATKGVVQLFNAVKQQQCEIETKIKESGPLERKREKVLKNVDKNSFLDVLMGGTKSIDVDDTLSTVKKLKKEEEPENNGNWKVLRDDFVVNASMKNWDKEDDSSENESDNDTCQDQDEDSDESS